MNFSPIFVSVRAVKWLLVFGTAMSLAGCGLFEKPDETRPVITNVYSPSVGKDVYSSLSPSHFLE